MEQMCHNLMEDIVRRHVDAILGGDGGCCCPVCRADVMAYALNHLPPRYVVTDVGRMMVQLDSCESQFRADVVAALSTARKVVREHPRHT